MAAVLAGGQLGKRSQVPRADRARVLTRGSLRHGRKPDADSLGLDASRDVRTNETVHVHLFRQAQHKRKVGDNPLLHSVGD